MEWAYLGTRMNNLTYLIASEPTQGWNVTDKYI